MIWLWRNSPGKLHLKIQSHLGDKEGTYHQIWAACWGKLYLKSPLWAWLNMPEDTKLRWTVLIALFPDFTWKWDADALPVPLIRLDLDHHHSSLTWLWAPVSLPACAHHTHPWKVLVSGWERQGNFQEISQMHRTWGSISFSARRSTFFSFSVIYWLPKFDERSLWAGNSMQSGWCPSVFLEIKHFHELIFQETTNYHFDPFRIKL